MSFIKEFQHLQIPLQDLKSATNDFADSNCIGRGGFGKVYKGEVLLSGVLTMVAVKRLDRSLGQGTTEFWKEIMMLSRYKHQNLVSLLGFCDEGGESLLVYEYLSKKSLDLYLISNPNLSWIPRLLICLGAARGLKFLHEPTEGCQHRILHRDIKSANILLDDNLQSKISDLGLSKLGPANQKNSFIFSNAVGTPGYCDPLYTHTGLLTKESDVYSFGIVMFEVLCGRPAYVQDYNDIRRFLAALARKCYEEKKLDTIIHSGIRETISPKSLERFAAIAYKCLHMDRAERPSMANIVEEILNAYYYQRLYKRSLLEFPLKEIEVATENFKTSFGESQYGQMYIGELSIFGKPTAVIVKRFAGVVFKDFLWEIYRLCDQPHPNHMSVIGYCDEERETIIVYEYPERGRLDQYISRSNATSATLTWLQRLKICIGAAQGLYHLHRRNDSHYKFKSANILLDDKWVARVYNFVMTPPSSTIIAEHAYSAPEYILSGIGTKEEDVYYLGMVLFEVLCGRLCTEDVDGYMLSAKLVKDLYEKKKLDEIVDPILREQRISSYSVDTYSAIAYRCLLDDPEERPSMGAVIKQLQESLTIEEELNNRFDQEGRKLQEQAKAVAEREKIVVEREKRFDQESRKLQERAKAIVEREKIAVEREKRLEQEGRKLQERAKAVAEGENIVVEREKKMEANMESIEEELARQKQLKAEMEDGIKHKKEMVDTFSEKDLKAVFRIFDVDGNGFITAAEMRNTMTSLGKTFTDQEIDEVVQKADVDGDGQISLEEFKLAVTIMDEMEDGIGHLEIDKSSEEGLKMAFRMLDEDGNGFITAAELRNVLPISADMSTDQEIDEFIQKADVDGDGQISFEEFKVLAAKDRNA